MTFQTSHYTEQQLADMAFVFKFNTRCKKCNTELAVYISRKTTAEIRLEEGTLTVHWCDR